MTFYIGSMIISVTRCLMFSTISHMNLTGKQWPTLLSTWHGHTFRPMSFWLTSLRRCLPCHCISWQKMGTNWIYLLVLLVLLEVWWTVWDRVYLITVPDTALTREQCFLVSTCSGLISHNTVMRPWHKWRGSTSTSSDSTPSRRKTWCMRRRNENQNKMRSLQHYTSLGINVHLDFLK